MEEYTYFKNIKILALKSPFTGRWAAVYTLPGEDETHTGFFAQDARTALGYARGQINRALDNTATEAQGDDL